MVLQSMPRVTYTKERIRFLLQEYQRLAQNAKLPEREEVLGTTPGRRQEASGLATARMKADLEQALQLVPFAYMQITFMALSVGNTDWHHGLIGWRQIRGKAGTSWYQTIGDWWGIDANEVHRIAADTVEMMYRELNGL